MKKIEAILPDALARQVAVLIMEGATEFHVYDQPGMPELAEEPARKPAVDKATSPAPKRPKSTAPADLTAKQMIETYLKQHGPTTRDDLREYAKGLGFAGQTITSRVWSLIADKQLIELSDGRVFFPTGQPHIPQVVNG